MVEPLGWLGLVLFICTLMPFVLRRTLQWREGLFFFSRYHHFLALACLAVLTLHGLWALFGRKGWGRGALEHVFSGSVTWLILLSVVALAIAAAGRKPFRKSHCWLVVLLALLVLIHVF